MSTNLGVGTGRGPRPPASGPPRGFRDKSLLGLPWRYALACMDELGLILRRDIIWAKPNGLPESVTDRCRSSHEYLFHLTVQPRYYAAVDEIREPQVKPTALRDWGYENKSGSGATHRSFNANQYVNPLGKLPGSVWSIPSQPLTVPAHLGVDHFAAFPMELPRRCILGWSPPGICTECGEGRVPVTELAYQPNVRGGTEIMPGDKGHNAAQGNNYATRRLGRVFASTTITGYACACPDATAPVRPAVVVDPFGGTGTTALVASMLYRTGISVDRLYRITRRLARWRTTDPAERAAAGCRSRSRRPYPKAWTPSSR